MRDSKMSVGRALGIFSDIENDQISDREKALAIYIVMNRDQRMNEILKEEMLRVIKWLWHRCFRARKEK